MESGAPQPHQPHEYSSSNSDNDGVGRSRTRGNKHKAYLLIHVAGSIAQRDKHGGHGLGEELAAVEHDSTPFRGRSSEPQCPNAGPALSVEENLVVFTG